MSIFSDKYGQISAILGGQWGDEGKGKLVDIMSEDYDYIVRANGGANAGHTVYVPNTTNPDEPATKYVFHLMPSGILHPGKVCVIGNGCVLHVPTLFEELEMLRKHDINTAGRLIISDRTHLLFEYHLLIDALQEESRGKSKIGTTKRGIGPCYMDKVARRGIRAGELLDFPAFANHFRENVQMLRKAYGQFDYSVEQEIERYREYAKILGPMMKDTSLLLHKAQKERKKILLEGANGLMLDIDHGSYPYVTSSSTAMGGMLCGAGFPPQKVQSVIGILKAYTTRVGGGPFPTELTDRLGDEIRERGGEYGATTNRPRRCGWFDVPVARYSVRLNGFSSINLTKLDVLTGIPTLRIGVRYFHKGQELDSFPGSPAVFAELEVEYIEMEGWKEDISQIDSFRALPETCKRYIQKIENLIECPIEVIGVGKERNKLIRRF
ncbi:adenylosuccinate synthase [Candidatus Peregrinibacteria bacterium]|nr:adenylosuccinate synthase [Candidatus Peregrinibacteria bacterium]